MAVAQLFTSTLFTALCVTLTAAGPVDICQWETFEARCRDDEVILIKEASYGRMKIGRCQPRNYFVGCSADVTALMHLHCSNRQHCSVPVPDSAMFASTPCPKDLVSYLQADYECVKVAKSNTDNCDSQILTEQNGYISSNTKMSTNMSNCPYLIVAQPGQTINVYISDFYNNKNMVPTDCIAYGSVFEGGIIKAQICGGELETNRLIYSSEANVVDISLESNDTHSYLLRYEITGCPTLQAPANSWIKVQDNLGVVTCNFSSTAFNLRCSNNNWIGDMKNCSGRNSPTTGSMSGNSANGALADSSFTVVCVGLALGVLCAVGLLTLALMYSVSFRNKNQSPIVVPQTPGSTGKAFDSWKDPASESLLNLGDQYQSVCVPSTNVDSRCLYTPGQLTSSCAVPRGGVLATRHQAGAAGPVLAAYSAGHNTKAPVSENTYGIVRAGLAHNCGHTIYDVAAPSHTLGRKQIVGIGEGCPV